ncbi:MAG: alpha/beta fold hydrolase [Solirubrobacteraceae bacterium]
MGNMMTKRYTVVTTGGSIAMELHRNVDVPAVALVVLVPGAPRDPSVTHTVTSAWESGLVHEVRRSDVAFATFNYLGVGASTGQIREGSIQSRRSQVSAIIRFVRGITQTRCLVLVGFSMGGHLVATLARSCNAAGVALIVPAAYGPRAEIVNFGPRLTTELRRPRSWRNSPAFAEYRLFSGRKLLIAPQHDEIIPPEVTATYLQYTDKAFVWRPAGVGHRFLACATQEDRFVTYQSVRRVAAFIELCVTEPTLGHRPNTEAGAVD